MNTSDKFLQYWIHTGTLPSLRQTPPMEAVPEPLLDLDAYGSSFIGSRRMNEDRWHIGPQLGLFVIADGMGSYEGGNAASSVAVETLRRFYERAGIHGTDPRAAVARLALAYRQAHDDVGHLSTGGVRSMGATMAAIRFENDRVVVGHIGDCRVYRYRPHHLERLTRDHASDGGLARTGSDVRPDRVGRTLTRVVGIGTEAQPDVRAISVERGDRFLLCTDGLPESLHDRVLQDYLAIGSSKDAARGLVRRAATAGSGANVSAVVVTVS